MSKTCTWREQIKSKFEGTCAEQLAMKCKGPCAGSLIGAKSKGELASMKKVWLSVLFLTWCFISNSVQAQTSLPSVEQALEKPVQPFAGTEFQLQQYLMARIPPLPSPATPAQWKMEEQRLRRQILDEIAYHGWPHEWIDSAPSFEQVGVI